MSSESRLHTSSPVLFDLLASTSIVVIDATEDSKTSDDGDSELEGTGT